MDVDPGSSMETEDRLEALRKERLDVQSAGLLSDGQGLSTIHEPLATPGLGHDRTDLLRQLDEEKAEMDRKFAEMMGKLEEQDNKIAEESKSREEVLAEVEQRTALVAASAPRVLPTVNTGMTRMVQGVPQGIPVLTEAAAGIWQGVKDFHIRRAKGVANLAVRSPAVATPYATYGPSYVMHQGVYRSEPYPQGYPLYRAPGLPSEPLRQPSVVHNASNNLLPQRVLTNGEIHANVPCARSIGSAALTVAPSTRTVVRRTVSTNQHAIVQSSTSSLFANGRQASPAVYQQASPAVLQAAPPQVLQAAPSQVMVQQAPAQSSYYDYFPGPLATYDI